MRLFSKEAHLATSRPRQEDNVSNKHSRLGRTIALTGWKYPNPGVESVSKPAPSSKQPIYGHASRTAPNSPYEMFIARRCRLSATHGVRFHRRWKEDRSSQDRKLPLLGMSTNWRVKSTDQWVRPSSVHKVLWETCNGRWLARKCRSDCLFLLSNVPNS